MVREVVGPDGSDSIQGDVSEPIEEGGQAGQEMAAKLLERAGEGFFDWRER